MNFIYIIQGNGAFQAPPSLMEAWDESYNRGRMLGVELGEESPSSQGPYSSFHVLSWWVAQGSLLLRGHVDHKLHHPAVVAEFIVVPENELDKVVIESNASLSIKDERVGVTAKITGNSLFFLI